jgi:hypothetical protein
VTEQPQADEQDLALPPAQIEELMQFLGKALRAQQLYLPNNPVYQQAIGKLRDAFRRVWEVTDDLVFDVTESDLRWEGHAVYSNASRSESIAFVLFKDGVRSVTFLPGVEEAEIVGFLDVIHRARTLSAEANDDLLTLLWEKDFQRLTYVFQEMIFDGTAAPIPGPGESLPAAQSPASVRRAVAEDAGRTAVAEGAEEEEEEAARPAGIVRADDFDTTLYFLDEKEIEYLRTGVSQEYAQDLRRNVLAMLFDVLELQPYAAVRQELISILENFLPYLLGAHDFSSVGYLLRESRAVLVRARELKPEHRAALERLPVRLSDVQALAQLLQALDESGTLPSAEDLAELFAELRPEALPTLFQWLSRLQSAGLRDVVEAAVQRLAAANTQTVSEALQGSDTESVVAAARVSGKLRLAPTVPALALALSHPEPVVRVTVVQALAEIASPAALQALEKGLDDTDREVRLASVRVIGQHKAKTALPRIAEVVQGRSMRAADLTEKMAFFEAYGSMVGEAGTDILDGILNSGGFLKRKDDPQTRACAAMALGRIGSEGARASLQRAMNDKEAIVRNAVSRALRGDRASTMMRAGELPS